MPAYGVFNAPDDDGQKLLRTAEKKGLDALTTATASLLAAEAGLRWSADGPTAVDVLHHGYPGQGGLSAMRRVVGKGNDSTELARYVEKTLALNLQNATATLQSYRPAWAGRKDMPPFHNQAEGRNPYPPAGLSDSTHSQRLHEVIKGRALRIQPNSSFSPGPSPAVACTDVVVIASDDFLDRPLQSVRQVRERRPAIPN